MISDVVPKQAVADGNLKEISVLSALSNRRTADEWVKVIADDLARSVEGIIAAGRNLVRAKLQLDHGEWLPLLKRLNIGERTAQRLMFIAHNLQLANPTHMSHLPSHVGTLYELAKLSPLPPAPRGDNHSEVGIAPLAPRPWTCVDPKTLPRRVNPWRYPERGPGMRAGRVLARRRDRGDRSEVKTQIPGAARRKKCRASEESASPTYHEGSV
jgi:hypothetical protein